MSKRPWRTEFFAEFAAKIAAAPQTVHRVLELGSGPGFLARHLLEAISGMSYVALDFSPAMHQLAAERLTVFEQRVRFVERDFKQESWYQGLGRFDCVVTLQAVHELRHKRHAAQLHSQVRSVLNDGGVYLVCDHFVGDQGMTNRQLYMTIEEQKETLGAAGFDRVEAILTKNGLVLHRAC